VKEKMRIIHRNPSMLMIRMIESYPNTAPDVVDGSNIKGEEHREIPNETPNNRISQKEVPWKQPCELE